MNEESPFDEVSRQSNAPFNAPFAVRVVLALGALLIAVALMPIADAHDEDEYCITLKCMREEHRQEKMLQLQQEAAFREVDRVMRLNALRRCAPYNRACAAELYGGNRIEQHEHHYNSNNLMQYDDTGYFGE